MIFDTKIDKYSDVTKSNFINQTAPIQDAKKRLSTILEDKYIQTASYGRQVNCDGFTPVGKGKNQMQYDEDSSLTGAPPPLMSVWISNVAKGISKSI